MRTRSKLILAGLAAALLMSFAVSSASANRLSVNNTRIRITWSAFEFLDPSTARMTCRITLEGSFHSATIRKVRGALIGYITKGIVDGANCEGGRATILQTSLPWHVTYDSFIGVLPDITGINLLLHTTAYQIEILGVQCLYAGDATHRIIGTADVTQPGRLVNTITPNSGIRLLRRGGGIFCPAEGSFRGDAQVFLLGNTSRIIVTLI